MPKASTLVITTFREDNVQGELGPEIASLLDRPVDAAEFNELEFVISNNQVEIFWKGNEIGEYSKVIVYGGVGRLLRIAHPLAVALRARGIDSFTSGAENYRGIDKLTQGVGFAVNAVQTPKTYFASPENIVANAGDMIGFPLVLKDILTSLGENNFLIKNQTDLQAHLKDMEEDRYIAQEYIENDGDIRILINDKGEYFAFKRSAADDSHLNNTSAGAKAEIVENLPDSLIDQCNFLVKSMQMPLLGIDVIEKDGDYYFLEANIQPFIFTGAFVEQKKRVFAQQSDKH